jgi:hypothetical protein
MTFVEDNQKERILFIKKWADFVNTHSDKEWSRQQNKIINSCIRSSNMTKEQFLQMKGELRNKKR